MAVRMDKIPAKAQRPEPPRAWLWLGLLALLLLGSVGGMVLFATPALHEQPMDFRGLELGIPLLIWSVLGFGRALLHFTLQSAADGWDEARGEDVIRKIRRGRRSQQVLGVSLYTALREPGQSTSTQLDALLSGTKALKPQASWLGSTPFNHSRLPYVAQEKPEHALPRILARVLDDLRQALVQEPESSPLALLLEIDCGLPERRLQRAWQQAWNESGIRQSSVPVEGSGLAALDHWLDHRIADKALLLVVAVQFAPQQPEGTAEAAVGLLLGNRLTQNTLPAQAYVHRPEAQRELTTEALLRATQQALDWVPMGGESIANAWRSGVDTQHDGAITTALLDIAMPMPNTPKLCNLDLTVGHPGAASPWLAIAAATQTIQRGAGPQFIFSGGSSVEAGLWNTVLTSVSPHWNKNS